LTPLASEQTSSLLVVLIKKRRGEVVLRHTDHQWPNPFDWNFDRNLLPPKPQILSGHPGGIPYGKGNAGSGILEKSQSDGWTSLYFGECSGISYNTFPAFLFVGSPMGDSMLLFFHCPTFYSFGTLRTITPAEKEKITEG
jgi:hypothetical protein